MLYRATAALGQLKAEDPYPWQTHPSAPEEMLPPRPSYDYGRPLPAQLSSGYQCHQGKCADELPAKAEKATTQYLPGSEGVWTSLDHPSPTRTPGPGY